MQTAARLRSTVKVENLDRSTAQVNGKSILEVLTLGAGPGHQIRVTVEGEDEQADLAEMASVIESGLGEELT